MRLFAILLLVLSLTGCAVKQPLHSTEPTLHQLPAKLYQSIADIDGRNFNEIGDISGVSCQRLVQDPPANLTTARQDMLVRADRMGANAVILQTCQFSGEVPGCYRQAICRGKAISIANP